MWESHVFLLFVIIYSFWEFASLSACDPQSCVCTCTVADHLHATQNALNQLCCWLAPMMSWWYFPTPLWLYMDQFWSPFSSTICLYALSDFDATLIFRLSCHSIGCAHKLDTFWYLFSWKSGRLAKLVLLLRHHVSCSWGKIGLPIGLYSWKIDMQSKSYCVTWQQCHRLYVIACFCNFVISSLSSRCVTAKVDEKAEPHYKHIVGLTFESLMMKHVHVANCDARIYRSDYKASPTCLHA